MARGDTRDWWQVRIPTLLSEGWVFYETQLYDPVLIRGFTPSVLPVGMPNTAANRRRLNRAFWLRLARTTAIPTDPWTGILRLRATSVLNPWAASVVPPFTLNTNADGSKTAVIAEAAWRVGADGHMSTASEVNPVVFTELDQARDAPTATTTKQYTNLWVIGDDSNWQTGGPNTNTMYTSLQDLFVSIAV